MPFLILKGESEPLRGSQKEITNKSEIDVQEDTFLTRKFIMRNIVAMWRPRTSTPTLTRSVCSRASGKGRAARCGWWPNCSAGNRTKWK